SRWGAFEHLWSLAVEEHFYLVWPLLVVFVPRTWLVRGCVVAVPVIMIAREMTDGPLAYFGTHLRMDAMLIGGLLAFAPTWKPSRATVMTAVVVLAAACHDAL